MITIRKKHLAYTGPAAMNIDMMFEKTDEAQYGVRPGKGFVYHDDIHVPTMELFV